VALGAVAHAGQAAGVAGHADTAAFVSDHQRARAVVQGVGDSAVVARTSRAQLATMLL
jgi:hypothetical protein